MLRKLRYSLVTLLVVFLFAGSVSAATTKTFSMTYSVDNEVARNIFPMLNEWRQSGETWYYNSSGTKVSCGKLDALSYDYNLEQVALQRAYEIAVSFAHARPDNTDCWTCYYNVRRDPCRGTHDCRQSFRSMAGGRQGLQRPGPQKDNARS